MAATERQISRRTGAAGSARLEAPTRTDFPWRDQVRNGLARPPRHDGDHADLRVAGGRGRAVPASAPSAATLSPRTNAPEPEGRLLKTGTAVDATLISASSSTKNRSGEHDPEMKQSKKANQWCVS